MGGYSCRRRTKRTNLYQVYGKWTIPTSAAGVYVPYPNHESNILPEMLFGFYPASGSQGFDIGIFLTGNNTWKAFYGSSAGDWDEKNLNMTLTPGTTLYANAWFEKPTSTSCVAHFTLSTTGYNNANVVNFTHTLKSIDQNIINNIGAGCVINREIVIAANVDAENTYENSGSYLYDAEFSQHTLMAVNNTSCVWSDSESANIRTVNPFPNSSYINGSGSNINILELRKDNGTVDLSHISATRTDVSSGATEKVVITFR